MAATPTPAPAAERFVGVRRTLLPPAPAHAPRAPLVASLRIFEEYSAECYRNACKIPVRSRRSDALPLFWRFTMGKLRIVIAILIAAGATAYMVTLEEYAGNLFRNTLQSWLGAPGETVALVMAGIYAAAVFVLMCGVSYAAIIMVQRGVTE
jgi:hypothetical protein